MPTVGIEIHVAPQLLRAVIWDQLIPMIFERTVRVNMIDAFGATGINMQFRPASLETRAGGVKASDAGELAAQITRLAADLAAQAVSDAMKINLTGII